MSPCLPHSRAPSVRSRKGALPCCSILPGNKDLEQSMFSSDQDHPGFRKVGKGGGCRYEMFYH